MISLGCLYHYERCKIVGGFYGVERAEYGKVTRLYCIIYESNLFMAMVATPSLG